MVLFNETNPYKKKSLADLTDIIGHTMVDLEEDPTQEKSVNFEGTQLNFKYLGKGAQGTAYSISNDNGEIAVKVIKCSDDDNKNTFNKEVKNIKETTKATKKSIPHLPMVYDSKEVKGKNNDYCIYTMKKEDGNLKDYFDDTTTNPENTCNLINILKQVIIGIYLLHTQTSSNLSHCDIKLDNIFWVKPDEDINCWSYKLPFEDGTIFNKDGTSQQG